MCRGVLNTQMYSYLPTCHFAPEVHWPDTEETSDNIHNSHNCRANKEPFHLLPQAMKPSPGTKNECIGKQEGPHVAMEGEG